MAIEFHISLGGSLIYRQIGDQVRHAVSKEDINKSDWNNTVFGKMAYINIGIQN